MGGASFPHPTFYAGTAYSQLGLGQAIINGVTTIIAPAASTVSVGNQSAILSPPKTSAMSNFLQVTNVGYANSFGANYQTTVGYNNYSYGPGTVTIGSNNMFGELFAGDIVQSGGNYTNTSSTATNQGMTNPLTTTTTGSTAAYATIDGSAALAPLGAPATPTFAANGSTGGTLPTGTYYATVTYFNAYGETIGSAESTGQALTLGQTLVINHPAANAGADGWNVYLRNTPSASRFQQSITGFTVTKVINSPLSTTGSGVPTTVDSSSNELSANNINFATGAIITMQSVISVSELTLNTVASLTRQTQYAISPSGVLTMLSAATGNTIGTDYNGITSTNDVATGPLVPATAIAFSVDDATKRIRVHCTPPALATHSIKFMVANNYTVSTL